MDDIDHMLLSALREDASQPLKVLGARVGLSASSVRERIARLQSSGAIRRFTIEQGPRAEGVTAILSVNVARTPAPAVVAAIVARGDVARCYSLSGPVDLWVEVTAASVDQINAARDAIAALEGVTRVETALVLKRDKGAV